MEAIVISAHGGSEVPHWGDVPDSRPGDDQVLTQVAMASVNHADIKTGIAAYYEGHQPPFIPGMDVSGVEVTGAAVATNQKGDRVISFPYTGSYAKLAVADQRLTFTLSQSLSFFEAGSLPVVAGAAYRNLVYGL